MPKRKVKGWYTDNRKRVHHYYINKTSLCEELFLTSHPIVRYGDYKDELDEKKCCKKCLKKLKEIK